MDFVAIGLGANLGDTVATIRAAAREIGNLLRCARLSPLYLTEPVGGPEQPDYVNAVVVGEISLRPLELLDELQRIECSFLRVRSGQRDEPRTLDLDILLFGHRVLCEPRLVVPHPRLAERRFALAPLADLSPRRVVPGTGKTVATLLREAPQGRVERLKEDRRSPGGAWSAR